MQPFKKNNNFSNSLTTSEKNVETAPLKLISNDVSAPNPRDKVMTRKRKRSQHPLRDLRLKAGFTLEELAELTDMSPSYLSRLESGTRRLNADILQRLSIALNCSPASLLPYSSPHLVTYVENGQVTAHNNASATNSNMPLHPKSFANVPNTESSQQTYSCDRILGSEILTYTQCKADQVIIDSSKSLQKNCNVLVVQDDNHAFIGKVIELKPGQYADQAMNLTIEFINKNHKKEQQNFKQNSFKAVYCVIGHIEAA